MKAKKTESGKYRVLVYLGKDKDGKQINKCITASTKKEAELLAAKAKMSYITDDGILSTMIESYIEEKKAVLSPNTLRSYKTMLSVRLCPYSISKVKLSRLTTPIVQRWISELSVKYDPKTVRNTYGLFTAAVNYYGDKDFKVKLPQLIAKDNYTPSEDDVKVLLSLVKHPELKKGILLGAYAGLRMEEVCALTADDITGNILTINKAVVMDPEKGEVVRQTKNNSSVRSVVIADWIVDEMPKSGKLVNVSMAALSSAFRRLMRKSGLPHFSFHDLRHHSASQMVALGIDLQTVRERHGWSSIRTAEKHYINSIKCVKDAQTEKLMEYYNGLKKV